MFNLLKKFLDDLKPISPLHVAFDSGGKDRPVIVFLHGIAATSKTWDVLLKEIDPDSYRIVLIDLLGFGKSVKPVDCEYNVDDHVKYIKGTLRRIGVRKDFILVGHSMGSIITSHYCAKYPKHVKRAYLLSLPLYPEDIKNQKGLPGRLTDFYINAYNLLCDNKAFTIKNSSRLRKILRINDGIDVSESTWNSFRLSLKNTIINQDVYGELKTVKIPICVIYGLLDQFLVIDNMKMLANLDNVKLIRLTAVDHSVGVRFSKAVVKQINEDNMVTG